MGTTKDRNSTDLREVEEIEKRSKNTEKNYTKNNLLT